MTEWSPWQTLEALRREIDRVFDENGSRSVPSARAAFLPGRAARRYPLINPDSTGFCGNGLNPSRFYGNFDVLLSWCLMAFEHDH